MGKLNFRGYLISRFYPSREIHKKMMHAENVFYSIYNEYNNISLLSLICRLDEYSKKKTPINTVYMQKFTISLANATVTL